MKILLNLILIFVLYFLYVLLRFVLKRIRLLRQIRRFAKENDLQCMTSVRSFLLPSNRCGTAVYLRTDDICYNICLFGLLRKNCAVHFWSKEMYSVEKFIPRMSLVDTPLGHRPARRRKLGKWNINSDNEIPVLLYSSANSPIHITQTQVNHVERLMAGDKIEDVLFVDRDFLFRYIANRI